MTLQSIKDKQQLADYLNKHLSKSRPIEDPQLLYGRMLELEKVEQGLLSKGTQVFIVGDRGVGKSSVGIIAAKSYQSKDNKFIHINCEPNSTFETIVASIVYEVLHKSKIFEKTETKRASALVSLANIFTVGFNVDEHTSTNDIASSIHDISDATRILKWVQEHHSERPIILIDEFDRIRSDKERNRFADLLKHIGDQGIGVKLLIVGISSNVSGLIGEHPSATRQIESVEIPRLNYDARFEIINKSLQGLDVEIDRDLLIRISMISDGYPYYVHLITEKLIWTLFNDTNFVESVDKKHFELALQQAIESCSPEYSEPYKKAVIRKNTDVEKVLWSTADTEYLERDLKEMFTSYEMIVTKLHEHAIASAAYRDIVNALTKSSHASILKRTRQRSKYFAFKENMLRGYVRLQAESAGVSLFDSQAKAPRPVISAPSNARAGFQTSRIPNGIEFSRDKSSKKQSVLDDT